LENDQKTRLLNVGRKTILKIMKLDYALILENANIINLHHLGKSVEIGN